MGKLFYTPYYAKAVPTFQKPMIFTNFATFTDLLQNGNIQVGTPFVKRLYKGFANFSKNVNFIGTKYPCQKPPKPPNGAFQTFSKISYNIFCKWHIFCNTFLDNHC